MICSGKFIQAMFVKGLLHLYLINDSHLLTGIINKNQLYQIGWSRGNLGFK